MVKCTNCKKVFDEDKYYGICPKCATYNRPKRNDNIDEMFGFDNTYNDDFTTQQFGMEDHDRMHRQYDGTTTKKLHRDTISTYEQMQGKVDAGYRRKQKTREAGSAEQRSRKTVMVIFVALFAIAMFACGIICVVAEKLAIKAEYTLEYETETVECGEQFEFHGIPVCVSDAEVIDTSAIEEGLPKNHKLIAIHTKVYTENYEWISLDDCISVYDGNSYKAPLSSYAMDSALIMLGIDSDEVLSPSGFVRRDGMFLVLIDEDAENITLVLDEKEEENKMDVLKKRYEVPLSLGE